jgi:hypothetical protein
LRKDRPPGKRLTIEVKIGRLGSSYFMPSAQRPTAGKSKIDFMEIIWFCHRVPQKNNISIQYSQKRIFSGLIVDISMQTESPTLCLYLEPKRLEKPLCFLPL